MTSPRAVKSAIFSCLLLFTIFILLRKNYSKWLSGIKPPPFEFPEISEAQKAKKNQSYDAQERTVTASKRDLDNVLPIIIANNSQPLPKRKFSGNFDEICETKSARCVPPYATIRPLIITAPEYRMMSCINQKSLSTVMSAVFCFLNRQKKFIEEGRSLLREYSDIKLCQGINEFPTVDSARKHLKVPIKSMDDWQLTMVTRDPVDRFLSGFIDRCIRTGDECFGCRSNMTCFMEKEYERMNSYSWADTMGIPKAWLTMEDIHVFPQNWRCQLDVYGNRYQFLRYSSDPTKTLLTDLTTMMKEQNVPDGAIEYIRRQLSAGRTAHSTVNSKIRQYLEDRLVSSPYLLELIVRMFYWDYKLLGYGFPTVTN